MPRENRNDFEGEPAEVAVPETSDVAKVLSY